MGEFDIQAEGKNRRSFDLEINEVLVHPNYERGKAYFDVAVILTKSFEFTSFVQPVCLPQTSSSNRDQYARISVELTGKWNLLFSIASLN